MKIELDVPEYLKNSCHYYKLLPNGCIQITDLGGNWNIGFKHQELAVANGFQLSTKEEFENKYNEVLGILKDCIFETEKVIIN